MRRNSSNFDVRWDRWQIEALREYNDKFHGPGTLFPTPRQLYDVEDTPDGIEVSEDGGIFEHNLGGVNFIGKVVTPFPG